MTANSSITAKPSFLSRGRDCYPLIGSAAGAATIIASKLPGDVVNTAGVRGELSRSLPGAGEREDHRVRMGEKALARVFFSLSRSGGVRMF